MGDEAEKVSEDCVRRWRGIDTRRADLPLSCELEVWMDAPRTSREENLRIQRRKQFLCGGARFHSAHNGQHRARQRGSIKGIAAQGETRRGSRESGSPIRVNEK